MTNEEKTIEFMNYVAKNEKELKYILAKNITYDAELFDDVFQDSIIKVYNSILKNGTTVSDYKSYFFTSLKWNYVLYDNRNKKYKSESVRDYFDNNDIIDDATDKEGQFDEVIKLLDNIKTELSTQFGEFDTEIYLHYFYNKINGGTSYKKVSEKYNITTNQLTKIIRKIKDYINSNTEFNKLYKSIKHYALY